MFTLLGTVACFGFTLFCLKKADEWGAGAFILWLVGCVVVMAISGTDPF